MHSGPFRLAGVSRNAIMKRKSRRDMSDPTQTEQRIRDDLRISPAIPATHEVVPMAVNGIRSKESYDRRIVRHGSVSGTKAVEVEFDESIFDAVDLSKSKWTDFRLRKVRFLKCDLANAQWNDSTLDHVDISHSRATGMQLLDAKCADMVLSNCRMNLSSFHGSRFRNCRWENCDLRESNFEGVNLQDVVFRNCDLRAARFPNCSLKNIDLRGSILAGVHIDPHEMRDALVDPAQLLDLAELFGLRIEPLEEGGDNRG
jgi:uncharacterized protein YjbI with pentapeptide repeats